MSEIWLYVLLVFGGGLGWFVAAYWFCCFCEALQELRNRNERIQELDKALRTKLLPRDRGTVGTAG